MGFRKRRSSPHRQPTLSLQQKASRILYLVFMAMAVLVARMWYLSVIQHEASVEKARRPQRREVLVRAERASIRDRFNIPLAVNHVQYNAAVLYAQIRQVPRVQWLKGEDGKKHKHFSRREHIIKLATKLAEELHLDSNDVEDLIHGKAALFPHVPIVVKSNISEEEYYRLRMMEKDWQGLIAERIPRRSYPLGRVASHVIGYMGAISQREYESYAEELRSLRRAWRDWQAGEFVDLPEGIDTWQQLRRRLQELEERAYTLEDHVGKSGIEAAFEEELRGQHGKKVYYSDARGNFLRELPGSRESIAGQRLLLSISAELQQYAEELLVQSEQLRDGMSASWDRRSGKYTPLKQPWIKGGAIVAMDPHTGEILALAGYPRFDPNDFIPAADDKRRNDRVHRWFENTAAIAAIWDGAQPLVREVFDPPARIRDEELVLDWNTYLKAILPEDHSVLRALSKAKNIEGAVRSLRIAEDYRQRADVEGIAELLNGLYDGDGHELWRNTLTPSQQREIRERVGDHTELDELLASLRFNYDKALFLDLCRLLVDPQRFDDQLLAAVGQQSLAQYKKATSDFVVVDRALREMAKELFHDLDFRLWREKYGKAYLRLKRKEEAKAGLFARPYLRYYQRMEAEMFNIFWERHRWSLHRAFLAGDLRGLQAWGEGLDPYASHLLTWRSELMAGAHRALPWAKNYTDLCKSLQGLSRANTIAYLKTMRSFSELDFPLSGRYRNLRPHRGNPLGKHLAGAFYPSYGFGFARSHAYRQAATQGSIFKVVTAYAALMQQYRDLRARGKSSKNLEPLRIVDRPYRQAGGKHWVVATTVGGKPIPQLYKGGRLIRSKSSQIGEVGMQGAMARSSNPYFSLLAGDYLHDPEDLNIAAELLGYGQKTGIALPGEYPGRLPEDLSYNKSGLYAYAIGQHTLAATPLQAAVMLSAIANGGKVLEPKIVSLAVGSQRERQGMSAENRYQAALAHVGIDFPLFTDAGETKVTTKVYPFPTVVDHKVELPPELRYLLLESMGQVVQRLQTSGRFSLMNHYSSWPGPVADFVSLGDQFVGKTSTAESLEGIDLDAERGTQMYNHVWFGGISFAKDSGTVPKELRSSDRFSQPELVVVVYLRYGNYGNLAAPIAAQMVKKWRAIKAEGPRGS